MTGISTIWHRTEKIKALLFPLTFEVEQNKLPSFLGGPVPPHTLHTEFPKKGVCKLFHL